MIGRLLDWLRPEPQEPKVGDPNYWPYPVQHDESKVLVLDAQKMATDPSRQPIPRATQPPKRTHNDPAPQLAPRDTVPAKRVYSEDEIAARALARKRDRECMNAARR